MKFGQGVALPLLLTLQPNVSLANLIVAGSCNLDTFLPISHLPSAGENLTLLPNKFPILDVPGGKGCNQAIACSKFSSKKVSFIGRVGDDDGSSIILDVLQENNIDIQHLERCEGQSTGRGFVFLESETGRVSAVVSGGSNMYGWRDFENKSEAEIDELLMSINGEDNKSSPMKCLLLQREIPENINVLLAKSAKKNGFTILQDIGGEDRGMSEEMMGCCDYIMPNLSELKRLVKSFEKMKFDADPDNLDSIVAYAKVLQNHGANNIIVTLAERGSLLITKDGDVEFQESCILGEEQVVVDETGAGDCYRAGFAVALSSNPRNVKECMQFASACGALACTKEGAVPSIPSREEVESLIKKSFQNSPSMSNIRRGGAIDQDNFPYMFGSRLNSMKDRPDLWNNPVNSVREWVKRQGAVEGLGCVDFNYPQHFHDWTAAEAKIALDDEGLVAGAVCLRYPSKFARGAMNHPDPLLRKEAIELTKEAAKAALELGCNEVVVWSAYDGYDYPFQVNYTDKWNQLVSAFQECCDAYPQIKWSLEYKPTDENTRFFTVPSTGAAMLLVNEIGRANMGLTLDVGHMLMSGENPAQSIAMVGEKLFGIQLNDGYTRLAAEDGMMFGSIHPSLALEIMYQLQEIKFKGHLYFDTFPQRSDPVKEAEYNIKSAKRFYAAALLMDRVEMRRIMNEHDAISALNMIDKVLKST